MAQTNEVQHIEHAAFNLAVRRFDNLHCKGNVLIYSAVRQQTIILEDNPQLTPHIRNLLGCQRQNIYTINKNAARSRQNLPEQHFDKGRLTSAAWSYNKDEFAWFNMYVDILQGYGASRVNLADILHSQHYLTSPLDNNSNAS